MKQFIYSSDEEYREAQIEANARKFLFIWATPAEMRRVADILRHNNAKKWLCHGSRNGFEVHALQKLLPGVSVTGTDIAPTASDIPGMICWDFSRANEAWREMDFIYTNAFDHARDPAACLKTWYDTLAPGGTLIINWAHNNYDIDRVDCFWAHEDEVITLLQKSGFTLTDIIEHNEQTHRVGRLVRRVRNSLLKRLGKPHCTSQEIPKILLVAKK